MKLKNFMVSTGDYAYLKPDRRQQGSQQGDQQKQAPPSQSNASSETSQAQSRPPQRH